MIFKLTNGGELRQPPEDLTNLVRVEMTAAEWADLQDLIRQIRRPWIRNANKDRGIRPARSASGYKLLSAQSIQLKYQRTTANGYRLIIESPYRLDAFTAKAALQMIRDDAERWTKEFGYERCLDKVPYGPGSAPVLFDLQLLMDYDRSPYYRFKVQATADPDPDRCLQAPRKPPEGLQTPSQGDSLDDRIRRVQGGSGGPL